LHALQERLEKTCSRWLLQRLCANKNEISACGTLR
jgi:hypothetical protein